MAAGCGGRRGGVDRCVDRQMDRQVAHARGRLVGAGWLAAGSLVFSRAPQGGPVSAFNRMIAELIPRNAPSSGGSPVSVSSPVL